MPLAGLLLTLQGAVAICQMTFSQMTNKEHTFSHTEGVTDKLNNLCFFLHPKNTFLFTFSGQTSRGLGLLYLSHPALV
jgi:hypothetical protein